ncbi:YheC/YheD family protein [Jeotgalibacillus proteolyticus]|uniref:ATP-grasp domain-containing protein n=1 Tax=Jeotgalibacillus proteolyticus TaxID=2082395 RepID=A0A2S5G7J3_9BACL|nr:YheC/YheD family protein [Jeotgalibacillus proteolyticus]PPA68950.1 hypothetical protein C4B60_18745 [Jeotgalibacillus proteolyticus]
MKKRLGKWLQYSLFSKHPIISKFIPETRLYTIENLTDLLKRYESVYLKNNRGGQGKGIFKVTKNQEGLYCFNGYTLNGKKIQMNVEKVDEFEAVLHPINRFGGYLVQAGIPSLTSHGLPFSLRVHVQLLKEEWMIGGIYGQVAAEETTGSSHRGAQIMTVDKLLSEHLGMDKKEQNELIKCIKEASIIAAEVASTAVPEIEYGIDFGISQSGNPVIYEINTSPGVGDFSKIGNGEMRKRIKAIRSMHLKG